jgi:hypothetical protein
MSLFPRTLSFAVLATLGLAGAPAFAHDHDGPPPPDAAWCKDHGDECTKMKQRREEFCKTNPQTCETAKKRHEAREEYCKDHKDECQKLKDERQARHEKMREACKADPKACDERKAEHRKHRAERRGDHKPGDDAGTPPSD